MPTAIQELADLDARCTRQAERVAALEAERDALIAQRDKARAEVARCNKELATDLMVLARQTEAFNEERKDDREMLESARRNAQRYLQTISVLTDRLAIAEHNFAFLDGKCKAREAIYLQERKDQLRVFNDERRYWRWFWLACVCIGGALGAFMTWITL